VATQAINEVREISYNLRPYQLDRLGLTKAILSITSRLASPVKFSMTVDPVDDEVEKDQAIHVYRIVQEGINNILKHAGAAAASITIRVETTAISIVISDDGRGLGSEQETDGTGRRGFGLVGITERAKVLNGTVSIDSSPGKGTSLKVMIPRRKVPT
jgi:signal transduction histidine kinase